MAADDITAEDETLDFAMFTVSTARPASKGPELDKLQAKAANMQWLIAQGIRESDPVLAIEKMARK